MHATDGIEDFLMIWEHGSIAAAARVLDVTRPTLSRRLAALEVSLGTRLLHRSNRGVQLTRAGEALLPRARRIVAEAQAARGEVAQLDHTPRGLLRLSVPPITGESMFFAELVEAFLRAWPEVQVEVFSSTRAVDLVAEGFDLALRAGPPQDDGLISRTLLRTEVGVVASPALLRRCPPIRSPGDLSALNAILGLGPGEVPTRHWPLRAGGSVRVQGSAASNDLQLRRFLALSGQGATLLPRLLVDEDLAHGRLVALLPDEVGAQAALRLVFVERTLMDPKVRAFLDHAVAWVSEHGPSAR